VPGPDQDVALHRAEEGGKLRTPERILVIRLSSLGDVVLASVVIGAIKRRLPQALLSILVKSEYAGLYSCDPRITHVIPLHPGHPHLLQLVRSLRKKNFDTIVDIHSNLRSLLIRNLVSADRKVHYHKRHLIRWAMVHLKWLNFQPRHTVDLYLDAVRGLGIRDSPRKPKLYVDATTRHRVRDLLIESGLSGDDILVGVSPGARWKAKRWRAEGFASVCDSLLQRRETKVLILGDKDDVPFVREILSWMRRRPIDMTARLDIQELMAAISFCRLFLSNDSGPMHIATALGVPVVSIFGPTHPKLGFSPLGEKDIVISRNLSCSPCSLHGEGDCRLKRRICMEQITPEMVLEALERLLPH